MEKKAISSDLIRGHIDTIILHTLLDGDKFAQQISDCIEEKSQNEYKINQATLYSSLKRLETLKHVSSYWYDSPTGRRKYFKLTELGRQTVEQNLSSWSYSRAIIDKLIDCSPESVSQPQIIEKIVEVPVEKTVYVHVSPEEKTVKTDKIVETKPQEVKFDVKTDMKSEIKLESSNSIDVNFRNIINGLIKSTVVQKSSPIDIQPINKDNHPSSEEKLKFNETISQTGFGSGKSNNGKIDFSDLSLKALKEGYKLRISSKDSGVAPGKFLINKINLYASFAIYLLVMLEFLFFTFYYDKIINFPSGLTTALIIVFTAFPVIRFLQYVKRPLKKTSKNIGADKILTASIIVFNLLIITFALNLILGINFNNLSVFIPAFIMPCVLYVNLIVYFILKFFISKLSIFVTKPKKTAL